MPSYSGSAESFQKLHCRRFGPGNGVGCVCTYEDSYHTVTGQLFSYDVLAVHNKTAETIEDELHTAFCRAASINAGHVNIINIKRGQPTWHATIKVTYNIEAPTDVLPPFFSGQKVVNAETTIEDHVKSQNEDGSVVLKTGATWAADVTLPLQHKALICASLNVNDTMLQLYNADSRTYHVAPHDSVHYEDDTRPEALSRRVKAHGHVSISPGAIVMAHRTPQQRMYYVVQSIDNDGNASCYPLSHQGVLPKPKTIKASSVRPVALDIVPAKLHKALEEQLDAPPPYAESV